MHDAMKAYHESWERELDRQFLKNDRYRKRAYICSPLSGSTAEEELSNIWRARAYMLYARTMLGYLARAPHAYLPMLLCDHVAAERALALQFGLQLLEQSEVLLICGDRISRGMKGEIHHAAQLGIPIIVYCEDLYLANHLFRSVPHGSQLVLIGDADQLPSVGPGAVLSEIIACGAVPVVRLDRIFRQSYGSRIAANAKLIRHGNLSLEYGEDFQFYDSCDMSASAQQIETLYLQETARYGVDNVALLTPYRQKTETGVNALNERLREKLNPQDGKKPEVAYRKRIYRLGDKVMQIKNCEDISNGDIGYITSVTRDDTDSVLTVDFGDGRIAEYDGSDLEMLDLAYASTIHKSQGSEYKSVIINLQCAHAVMLVRPLVYTAITRAKERVLIVGERRALCIAIKRTDTEQRGTMLSARIKELISNVKGDHYNGNLAQ